MSIINNIEAKNKAFNLSPERGLTFIEQLQILAIGKCTHDKRPYLTGVNFDDEKLLHVRANCKMWSCETCGANNARVWIARIINGVNMLGGRWFFLTLTANRKTRGLKSVPNIRTGWKKFYNRILANFEKTAKDICYIKVWEQHEDGTFHLHILINICLGKRWAKNNAATVGLGYQAEWNEVDNAGKIAGYVSKYSLKNATIARGGIAWPKGLRRIEGSRNWPKLTRKETNETWKWFYRENRTAQIMGGMIYQEMGFKLTDKVEE
jgi:hypothetical protein